MNTRVRYYLDFPRSWNITTDGYVRHRDKRISLAAVGITTGPCVPVPVVVLYKRYWRRVYKECDPTGNNADRFYINYKDKQIKVITTIRGNENDDNATDI